MTTRALSESTKGRPILVNQASPLQLVHETPPDRGERITIYATNSQPNTPGVLLIKWGSGASADRLKRYLPPVDTVPVVDHLFLGPGEQVSIDIDNGTAIGNVLITGSAESE